MQNRLWHNLVRELHHDLTDQQLLEQFLHQGSHDAFAQLVVRYGPLVWNQCRNSLMCEADAEDAFQATMLILARSAGRLLRGVPLGPWLHGVAFRVCKQSLRRRQRQRFHENVRARTEPQPVVSVSAWESLFLALNEEVQKLPRAERSAFVLCYLEGRSSTEAGEILGVKSGTVTTRVSRAKQKLLDRLSRRGFGLGLVVGAISASPRPIHASLVEKTVALLSTSVAVPQPIASLIQGVIVMGMIRTKVVVGALLVMTCLGLSGGVGWLGTSQAQRPGQSQVEPPAKAEKTAQAYELEIARLTAELKLAQIQLDRLTAQLNQKPAEPGNKAPAEPAKKGHILQVGKFYSLTFVGGKEAIYKIEEEPRDGWVRVGLADEGGAQLIPTWINLQTVSKIVAFPEKAK